MEVDGRTMIVVAGGYTKPKTFLDTVEILDPLSSGGKASWSKGPKLPYKMVGTSMVTAPGGKGVIIIGGLVNYYDEKEDNLSKIKSNQLWVLKAKAKEWVISRNFLLTILIYYFMLKLEILCEITWQIFYDFYDR